MRHVERWEGPGNISRAFILKLMAVFSNRIKLNFQDPP
jgi:hypothetical protein